MSGIPTNIQDGESQLPGKPFSPVSKAIISTTNRLDGCTYPEIEDIVELLQWMQQDEQILVELLFYEDTSSIYHRHIEHFFAFLLEILFLVCSVNRPADSSSCPWLGWVSFPLGFLCLMTGH